MNRAVPREVGTRLELFTRRLRADGAGDAVGLACIVAAIVTAVILNPWLPVMLWRDRGMVALFVIFGVWIVWAAHFHRKR